MTKKQAFDTLREELNRDITEIEVVRDKIALRLHLGGMDAKSGWKDLEKKLERLKSQTKRDGDDVVEATRGLAREVLQSLKDFAAKLP